MKSLYGKYIEERAGRHIVEKEHGFATYQYMTDNLVYIQDIYVEPEYRKSKLATQIADEIVDQAVKDGKRYLLGSVDLAAIGADVSKQVLKSYGMSVYLESGSIIFYIKEIGPKEVCDG